MSRPARALWIEIESESETTESIKSRPARALWIEIEGAAKDMAETTVEAREGLVD